MLILYFDRIGWPTSVPTSEKGAFMKRVLREKKNALDDLVMSKAFPLRPGVEEFIDEASKDGVPVVFLTAYGSSGEKIARFVSNHQKYLSRGAKPENLRPCSLYRFRAVFCFRFFKTVKTRSLSRFRKRIFENIFENEKNL
ncbi:Hypothetical predicted protein [Olea europaea subsp. europaea]|uniref:Uncharacterized protein n=1 Tax=Olea europaea subsp. europaea TaxID=158383 RepID=A0A8S0RFH5_OLEEU|nr:Hypothetical predicted protein [Olea europaea subsp. europaea]